MTDFDPKALIVRAEHSEGSPEQSFTHPLNPKSQVYGTQLSRKVGLERVGVSRVTVPAGKESFAYHAHYADEEWLYTLSGRGIAEIGDEELEVGPGDFIGFPAPSCTISTPPSRSGRTRSDSPSCVDQMLDPAYGRPWWSRSRRSRSASTRW
jgi:mannose-6-phosphate isomerase-like protein (cupin superfamily)